jgi:UDPglucose--hexose-1-phosphate uridylyltransferase
LRQALGALFNLLQDPDYNLVVVTPPLDQVHRLANHWFIDVIPRITTPAGFELGSRIIVNIQPPERAAAELRAAHNALENRKGGDR